MGVSRAILGMLTCRLAFVLLLDAAASFEPASESEESGILSLFLALRFSCSALRTRLLASRTEESSEEVELSLLRLPMTRQRTYRDAKQIVRRSRRTGLQSETIQP